MANAQATFPFDASLTIREKGRLARFLERYAAFKELCASKGMLVPVKVAAALAGVGDQRIRDLIEEGRIESTKFEGHIYVVESSLFAWASSDRKSGRPAYKDVGLGDCVRMAKEAQAAK